MRRAILGLAVLVILGADGPAPSKTTKVSAERAKFDGSWSFTSMEYDGKAVPADDYKDSRLILKGDQYTIKSPTLTFRGNYLIDPTSNPKRIDVTFEDGPNQGQVSRGIYELDGDTYRSCMGLAGKPRPTTFAAGAKSGNVLQVAKRVKP
jgi:uncharacterized protein (TIGR03067 family)